MAFLNRMAAMAAAGLLCSAVGANAAVLIDLTDSDFITNGQYNAPITGLESGIPGIKFSIAGSATPLRNDESGNQSPGGCLPGGAPLACDNDGFGIGDDEVTGENQSITLTFDGVVGFEKFYFLDLYYNVPTTDAARAARGTGYEEAKITIGTQEFTALAIDANGDRVNGGFREFVLDGGPIYGTTATFMVTNIRNKDDGTSDAALAGLSISAVPLPAAGILLLGAPGGLGFMSRKRKAA